MVNSMIFDLATLTITVMAFTSSPSATVQIQNGQVNVYESSDCNPETFYFTINGSSAGSVENNCNAFCGGQIQHKEIIPNWNGLQYSMKIFNTNEDPSINQTTCYFFPYTCGSPGTSSNFNYQRSDQGCQVIPANDSDTNFFTFPVPVVMSCYTGAC